jgi:hypothetical protein
MFSHEGVAIAIASQPMTEDHNRRRIATDRQIDTNGDLALALGVNDGEIDDASCAVGRFGDCQRSYSAAAS